MKNWRCWLRHRWVWTGRTRRYPGNPQPHYPFKCERCGKTFETVRPEKYARGK